MLCVPQEGVREALGIKNLLHPFGGQQLVCWHVV